MVHDPVRQHSRSSSRRLIGLGLLWLVAGIGFTYPASAAETRVAVAANFTAAAQEIAAAFEEKTGHRAILSFGSTGQLFVQIAQGAPFEVFLAADTERPEATVEAGLAVEGSRFTYAVGRIVLWSRDSERVTGDETLRNGTFDKLAIANPETAPYGQAAIETMTALGLFNALEPKLVYGKSIAQTHQFITTGNAELGFVALSQIAGEEGGSCWEVPPDLYSPIRQDAVLLKTGADNKAARAFLSFLREETARRIIENYGYATGQ